MENTKTLCHNDCYILESIALEQAALAHILNAEGEKILCAVANNATVEELLCINQSVNSTICRVTELETVLLNKLEVVLNCGCCPTSLIPPTTPTTCAGRICVMINDCQSCRPLSFVRVFIFKNDKFIASGNTNCDGAFTSPNLCCGCYTIKVVCGESCKCTEVNVVCNQCVFIKTCF